MKASNQKLFNRTRGFFKVMYILVIVFIVLSALSKAFLIITRTGIDSYPVLYGSENPTIGININGEIVNPISFYGFGAIIVKDSPTWLTTINAIFLLIAMFIFLIIIRSIRSIIKSITENEVFSMENARRLKIIGFLILIRLILSYADITIASNYFNSYDSKSIAGLIGFFIGDSAGYIVAMVFVFFIAAIFKIGVSMQEENKSFV